MQGGAGARSLRPIGRSGPDFQRAPDAFIGTCAETPFDYGQQGDPFPRGRAPAASGRDGPICLRLT